MKNFVSTYLLGLFVIFTEVEGWPCVSTVTKVLSRVNTDAVLNFDLSAYVNQQTRDTFRLRFYDNSIQALIKYTNGVITTDALPGVQATADMSGNIVVTKQNIGRNNAGIYYISSASAPTRCSCLYILGTPTQPSVSVTSPSVGGSATLTCTSISTTTPSNHSLGFMYNWRVDSTDNPSGTRYSYSINKNTLTLSNIVKDDANKQFTCTATEDVSNGYTSSRSDSMSIDVHYGPEDVDFISQAVVYERHENTEFEPITCKAICNPPCSFQWTKVGDDSFVTTGAVLQLGKLSSSMAGTYRCKAMRTGGTDVTKDLAVHVIYGPRNMNFTPGNTSNRYNVNSNPPQITCSSSCWLCEYRWAGPNSYSSSGHVLDLGSLKRSMHGQYTCTATNTKESSQRQEQKGLTIEVRYGPDRVNVMPTILSYTVDEDSTLDNIKCDADCFPDCTYRWTKEEQNDVVMSNTNVLYLGHINKSHTGNYTCTATNGDITTWTKEIRVSIQVRYGPYSSSTELSPPEQGHIRNEGSTTLPDIKCYADCFPNCKYTWTKSRQGVTTTVATTNGVLSLNLLNRQDAGNYTCTATNPGKFSAPETNKTVEVHIRYGPDTPSVSVKSPYTVNEGSVLDDVRCSADCYPVCSFSWFNETSRSKISSDNVLSLGTVNRYMAGIYRCTSSNTAPEYKHSSENKVTVIVQYAPDVNVSIVPNNFTEGANVTLHCIGVGVPAENNYKRLTQMVNGIQIKNTNKPLHGTNPSSIHFQELRFEDTGTYTCTLNNNIKDIHGILDQTGSKDVIVEVLPKVLADHMRFTGATGGKAEIKVPFYSYPDLIDVEVTRHDGTEVESNDKYNKSVHSSLVETIFYNTLVSLDGYVAEISIFNLEEDDFGNYSLRLTNRLGFTSELLFVIAEGPPSPPLSFHILVDREHPTFIWERNFNGGLEQSFIIQTAPIGTEQWINHYNIKEENLQYKMNSTFYIAEIRLQPGIYKARILANNSKGYSEPVDIEFTFEILNEKEDKSSSAAIVGGLSASLLVIASVVIAFIVLWRKGLIRNRCFSGGNSTDMKEREEAPKTTSEVFYYNLPSLYVKGEQMHIRNNHSQGTQPSNTAKSNDDSKAHDRGESESACQYETLQKNDGSGPSQHYEMLHINKDRVSLCSESVHVADRSLAANDASNGDKIYENLKLSTSAKMS